MRRTTALVLSLALFAYILAGCSQGGGDSSDPKNAPNYSSKPTLPPPKAAAGGGAGAGTAAQPQ